VRTDPQQSQSYVSHLLVGMVCQQSRVYYCFAHFSCNNNFGTSIVFLPLSVQLFSGTRPSEKQHLVIYLEVLLQLIMMLRILGLRFWF